MMKVNLVILLFLILNHCGLAQKTTVISFNESLIVSDAMFSKQSAATRSALKALFSKTGRKMDVSFDLQNNFIVKHGTSSNIIEKGKYQGKEKNIRKDIDATASVEKTTIIKNEFCNCYKEISKEKKKSFKIATVTWNKTKEMKTILNYNCVKAITTFKNRELVVWFTKEIKGKSSPNNYPFIDGVILEYNDGMKKGIATKIAFNQPDVKNFF